MEDAKFLFKRDQTWWVKVAVPRTLRDALGYDLRRSLHTQDLEEAKAARDILRIARRSMPSALAALSRSYLTNIQ